MNKKRLTTARNSNKKKDTRNSDNKNRLSARLGGMYRIPVSAAARDEVEAHEINGVLPARGIDLPPDLSREIHVPLVSPFPHLHRNTTNKKKNKA